MIIIAWSHVNEGGLGVFEEGVEWEVHERKEFVLSFTLGTEAGESPRLELALGHVVQESLRHLKAVLEINSLRLLQRPTEESADRIRIYISRKINLQSPRMGRD